MALSNEGLYLSDNKFLQNFKKNFLSFFILIVVIFITSCILANIPYVDNSTSALYLLSALAQSQSAIVAIVITISIVALQLSIQSYSIHIIRLFRKQLFFWILLFLYCFSIIYDLILLELIPFPNINQDLIIWIRFANVLLIINIILLIWYILRFMEFISLESIIKNLTEEIPFYFKNQGYYSPLLDIAYGSMARKEQYTSSIIINSIENEYSNITKLEFPILSNKLLFFDFFIKFYKEMARIAIKANYEDIIETILKNLSKIVIEKEEVIGTATHDFIDFLRDFALLSLNGKCYDSTKKTIICFDDYFGKLYEANKQFDDTYLKYSAIYLNQIGGYAQDSEKQYIILGQVAVTSIHLGIISIEKNSESYKDFLGNFVSIANLNESMALLIRDKFEFLIALYETGNKIEKLNSTKEFYNKYKEKLSSS